MKYGDKTNYRKIDLYYGGKYAASTTWSRTCKEAVDHYKEVNNISGVVHGYFANKQRGIQK